MKNILLRSLLLILASLSGLHAESIRVAGSDLLASALQEPIANFAAASGLEVEVALTGSSLGRRELLDGTADLAIIASPEQFEDLAEFVRIPLAFQVVAVVVHESNPTNQLSIPQLTAIFGQGGAVNIEDWGTLGAGGVWRARKINLQAIRKRNNIALELFKAQVLGDQEMKGTVTYWSSTQSLAARIIEDNTSISIMPTAQPRPLAKILFISRSDNEQSYSPSPDNVLFGDYPLRMPFYLIYRKGEEVSNKSLNTILRFLLSEEVAHLLTEAEYMPLVESERRQHLENLDD